MRPIPHSKPSLGPSEAQAVTRVLKSGLIAQGRETELFEQEAAVRFGAPHAAAVSSGTKALELALRALDVRPGDEVVIPDYSCSSLWQAVRHTGATARLADCDPVTLNPAPAEVLRRCNSRTNAIILPHLFGLPCEADRFRLPGVAVIEDCAQAAGATYRGRPLASFGDAAIFSFYATKLLTCGEGGMVLCRSRALSASVRDLRQIDEKKTDRLRDNAKMTDLQSALGRVQLRRLADFLRRRRRLAEFYYQELAGLDATLPPRTPGRVYFRFVVRLAGPKADAVISRMQAKGVMARKPVYRPLHLDVAHTGSFPNADSAQACCVSLPIYPDLNLAAAARVCEVLTKSL
jgi:dTDP-4-amino-4,6-dideoxygalactose transaminase